MHRRNYSYYAENHSQYGEMWALCMWRHLKNVSIEPPLHVYSSDFDTPEILQIQKMEIFENVLFKS